MRLRKYGRYWLSDITPSRIHNAATSSPCMKPKIHIKRSGRWRNVSKNKDDGCLDDACDDEDDASGLIVL